ncbi:MAG TPA: hypothetical protein VE819_06610 [Steroidobacteraceae bacterium]|nr:hypothetical protein [Steroidobacteraceae bacterium]
MFSAASPAWEARCTFNIRFDIDAPMALENVREIVRVIHPRLGTAD